MNQVQQTIFNDRYARKDSDGQQVEQTIEEMWERVSNAIGKTDADREAYYRILDGFHFIPGGRIMSGAGSENEKTPYNCFVIPVETDARRVNRNKQGYNSQREDAGSDSREAIFDTIKCMVDIMSRGGGVGINWSALRPSGAYLTRVSGTSSGPVGWMDVASTAVGEVEQGGSRRGAAMFMLDDWHPDVLRFIEAKTEKGKITNANISVAVSDEFMAAVKDDLDWELRFPVTSHPAYNTEWTGDIDDWTERGYPVQVVSTIKSRRLWGAIADSAHASGEPGVVFLGRYNALSTAKGIERIISVNPCGEQGLGAYSVCNLGAMNLAAYVQGYFNTTGYPSEYDVTGVAFNFNRFSSDVKTAIRFLDDVIDRNSSFLPETDKQQKMLRRIGLSVMGLADALVMLGIRYGSPESVQFVEDVFSTMKDSAIMESNALAVSRGMAQGWNGDMWDRPYLKGSVERLGLADAYGMRNLFLLTQAPTGTTSLLAGVNSGIEPYFNIRPYRVDRTGERFVDNAALASAIGDGDRPDWVVTSQEVTVEEHIAIQAAVQRHVDSSVSKTINAPKEQTKEETLKAFTMAYDAGLKGIAYYRDGSRDIQVLYHESPNETIAKLEAKVKELSAKLAFKVIAGWTEKDEESYQTIADLDTFGQDLCPDCQTGVITYEEGCKMCHDCGWSAC